jgi:membrane-bound serine protease (ClpP class)
MAATPAVAQLSFGGDEEEGQKDKDKDKDDEEAPEDRGPPPAYTKPAAPELPEGPVEVLSGPIAEVHFVGIVNPGMGEYTVNAIARAEREKAQAVLISIDTPGGLVSTTETIVQAILGARVPVIVFVSPSGAHAASAGTLITLAGHLAAMAPATRIGAAHPVGGSGKDLDKHLSRKAENDLAALIEGIAHQRGRNAEWAINAVRRSESIDAERALEIGVVDLIASDRAELLQKVDGRELVVAKRKVRLSTRNAAVVEYAPTLRERLVNLLANPGIAMLLGVLGLIGILVEVYHPGMIAPGVMGVLCIICSLIAVEQLPIDLGGAILVLAGLGLLIAEVFTATYGALAVLGGIALTFGLLLLVDTSAPGFAVDPEFRLGIRDVVPVVGLMGLFIAYLSVVVVRSRRLRPVTGREAILGAVGQVLKPVDANGGMVFVQGEYWQARASEPIPEKAEIEVVGMEGLVLKVRRKTLP